jgi:O-antigen ligase
VWLFPRCSTRLRLVLAAAAIPSVTLFVLAERRAAVIALGVGLLLLCVFTFHRNRRAFWWFVPVLAVMTVGYLGAFWNTETGLGFPAQAVKGVIAPGQLSEADQSSNAYRDAESFNIWTTIRASPVLGIGFGQRFYRPIPMADISFFVFWEYLPHNAFLWMWMKTGVVGFLAYLYLSGLALQAGARSIVTARRDQHAAVIFTGLTAVAMFLVFSYVDIAWGARTALFLGVALACCADFPREDDEDDEDDLGTGAAVLREAMVAPDRSAGVEREAVLVDGAHTR